jgi:hypothetical protein
MGDLLTRAKDLSGVFAGASAVLYVFGYLVVRSRSRALGTDPDFAVIDQAYVFAGARLLIITLVAFLLVAPIVVGLHHAARRIVPVLPVALRRIFQILAALTLGILSLTQLSYVLGSDGLLACSGPAARPNEFFRTAVLGQSYYGLGFVVLGTGAAALSIAWLWEHRRSAGATGLLSLLLVTVVALQVLLLPLQVGAYYPDLKIRELAHAPSGLTGVAAPLWLIDRGSDRVVLLTRNADNRFALVNIKIETLDGIATTGRQLDEILQHGELACSAASSSRSD